MNKCNFSLIVLIIFLISCNQNLMISEFGSYNGNKFAYRNLDLKTFKDFKSLEEKIQEIACNDSYPRLILESTSSKKIINFETTCLERYACLLIMQRNIIIIEDDSIYKASKRYPLDSISYILKKDFNNSANDPVFSDRPDKIRIQISVKNKPLYFLETILDSVTNSYTKLESKTKLNLSLERMIRVESIPSPPKPIY